MSVRTTTLSSRGQIVLPKQVREELGVKPGDALLVKVQDGNAILTPLNEERLRALEDLFAWWRRKERVGRARRRAILPAVMEVRYGRKK